MQLKCKDILGGSFKKNHQQELPSLELEISLRLMELFRTSTRSVLEEDQRGSAVELKATTVKFTSTSFFQVKMNK